MLPVEVSQVPMGIFMTIMKIFKEEGSMKRTFNTLFVFVLVFAAISACKKEQQLIEPQNTNEVIQEQSAIMSVIAGEIETKTAIEEVSSTNYTLTWTKDDAIAAYEVSTVSSTPTVQGKTVSSPLAADATTATFTMDFSGNAGSADFSYIFVYPAANYSTDGLNYLAEIPSSQTFTYDSAHPEKATFDRDADLLISEAITDQAIRPTSVSVAFERIGATARMNIKAPTTDETIESITFSTTEGSIAGKIAVNPLGGTHETTITSGGENAIVLTPSSTINYTGEIPVWFRLGAITLADNFTVVVRTNKKTYEKTIDIASASKTVVFQNSRMTKFNVNMSAVLGTKVELTGSNMAAMVGANAYGNKKVYESGSYKWVTDGSKAADDSQFIQLRTDGTPYIELPIVPGTIQSVVFSVTDASAKSEGETNTTSVLSFHGAKGASADVSSDGSSTKLITLIPTADTYRNGFIHSTGAIRIWNIKVFYAPDEATVSSLAITTDPTKTSYVKDETVIFDGIVTATFSDGTTADVTSMATLTADTSSAGSKKVRLSYGGQYVEYDITVTAKTTVYTMSTPKSTTNNSYASTYDVEIDLITWNAPGNQSFDGYWRIGGAKKTSGTRVIYEKAVGMVGDVDEVVISTNGVSNANLSITGISVTAHSTSVLASTGEDASKVTFNTTASFPYNSTTATDFTFTKSGSTNCNGYFYRITISYDNSGSSNAGLNLSSIVFYKN